MNQAGLEGHLPLALTVRIMLASLGMCLALSISSIAWAQTERSDWPHEAKVDQFLLHSDFELDDQERLEKILGGLRSDITRALGLPSQQTPIHVVLFSNAREYSRYMQHYFPSIAQRRAIYLQDRGPGMLFTYWHDDIDTDLRHEASHAVLNQTGVQLPLWLDEGLAEYFELPRDKRFGQNNYSIEVTQRAAEGLVPSMLELERIQNMASFTDEHYRDSWAWVHFMLHRRKETRQLLIEYVARHRRLAPQMHLARQLSEIVQDPVAEFQQHFSKVSPTAASKVSQASFPSQN